jgi:hypothetical protein
MLNDETEELMRVTSLVQYITTHPGISSSPVKHKSCSNERLPTDGITVQFNTVP